MGDCPPHGQAGEQQPWSSGRAASSATFALCREQWKMEWKLLLWAILGSYWGYIEDNEKEHGNYYNGLGLLLLSWAKTRSPTDRSSGKLLNTDVFLKSKLLIAFALSTQIRCFCYGTPQNIFHCLDMIMGLHRGDRGYAGRIEHQMDKKWNMTWKLVLYGAFIGIVATLSQTCQASCQKPQVLSKFLGNQEIEGRGIWWPGRC